MKSHQTTFCIKGITQCCRIAKSHKNLGITSDQVVINFIEQMKRPVSPHHADDGVYVGI